jgi:hypothetical protein
MHLTLVVALARYREHSLDKGAVGRLLEGREPEEGANGGQAQVTRPDAGAPLGLEISEERADERHIQIVANTIASYRDTFRLLFTFAQARLRKPPSALAIADAGLPLRSCGLSKKASPSAGRRHALWETQYSPIAQHRDRHEARAALVRPRRSRHCNQQTPPCQPSPPHGPKEP